MTREAAYALADDVTDAGYSCTVDIGVHEGMSPTIHAAVAVHAMRFEAVALQHLIDVGDKHNLSLHLIGDQLRFIERIRERAA